MKPFSLISLLLSAGVVSAQVDIDKTINLTGADGDRKITNLELPVDGTDAANKDYVDTSVSASGGGGLPTMITDESATNMNFGEAVRYCNALDQGGHSDWRLPTWGELLSVLSQGGVTVANASSANYIFFQGQFAQGSSTFLNQYRLSDGTLSGTSYWAAITGRARCVR